MEYSLAECLSGNSLVYGWKGIIVLMKLLLYETLSFSWLQFGIMQGKESHSRPCSKTSTLFFVDGSS